MVKEQRSTLADGASIFNGHARVDDWSLASVHVYDPVLRECEGGNVALRLLENGHACDESHRVHADADESPDHDGEDARDSPR